MLQTPTPTPIGHSRLLPHIGKDCEGEVTYADADYKDLYEFGPVSYKNVSQEAAARKKAEIANRFNTPRYQSETPIPKSNKQD